MFLPLLGWLHHQPAIFASLPANIFSNKLTANNIPRNLPLCSFVSKWKKLKNLLENQQSSWYFSFLCLKLPTLLLPMHFNTSICCWCCCCWPLWYQNTSANGLSTFFFTNNLIFSATPEIQWWNQRDFITLYNWDFDNLVDALFANVLTKICSLSISIIIHVENYSYHENYQSHLTMS